MPRQGPIRFYSDGAVKTCPWTNRVCDKVRFCKTHDDVHDVVSKAEADFKMKDSIQARFARAVKDYYRSVTEETMKDQHKHSWVNSVSPYAASKNVCMLLYSCTALYLSLIHI